MAEQLIVYRRFNDLALSDQLVSLLESSGVVYEVEDNSVRINPLVDNDEMSQEYLVKISQDDFEKVNKLLLDDEKQYLDDVDADYYLLSFADSELMDVLTHYDEWNSFDVALARKLLNERGQFIDEQAIAHIKENRLKLLEQPEKPQTFWITVGYVTAFLGGILGIFIGWHLWQHKKTLPNGEQVYAYLEADRRQGNRIFILSIIIGVLAIILKIMRT